MASSSKRKCHPHQTGRIIDFFPNFRGTARSDFPTSGVKPHKLKRLRDTAGVDKPRKQHTVATVNTATFGACSEDVVQTTSTVECVITDSDACSPAVTKEPWKCHLQSSNANLPSLSSHTAQKNRKCTGNIYSEKRNTVKRMPKLSHTLGWTTTTQPVVMETTDETPICDHLQDKKNQHHLPLKSVIKSTPRSCYGDLLLPHKEQSGEMQTSGRTHLSKKAEKTDTQDISSLDQQTTLCALQPGRHVFQKPHDNLLWGLPWPTSPLLRNLRRWDDPLCSSSMQKHSMDWPSVTTQSCPPVKRQWGSGRRRDLSEDILKQLLEEIKVTNPIFPVQKFFTVLSKKREKILANQVAEGYTLSPGGHSLRGKRKRRLEGLSPGLSPKRRRSNHRPEERQAAESGLPVGAALDMLGHTPKRLVSRSRLSRTRRRREEQQEKTSPSEESSRTLNQNTESHHRSEQFHGEEIQREEDVLWTEKYQPQHSSEVVGNPAGVKKLHTWLKAWKKKADKEECRRRKEEMQRKKSKGSWDSGDFEGEVVEEDCEVELGTALLITGPHGVGKTAAVYACAQELGFKVFEVNASSQRSGRLLLAQLKEATLSHQVGTPTSSTLKPTYFASHSTPGCAAKPTNSPQKANSSRNVMTLTRRQPSTSQKSSLRKGRSTSVKLTHFFQKTNKPDNTNHGFPNHIQHDVVHNVKPNIEKIEAQGLPIVITDDEDNHPTMTKAGKSTLMSLILFEEVDVIFSEDVGFLSAIKTFMSTTKRPVVLTTTDPWFGGTFDGRLEELQFKKPPVKLVCSYLQLVCLVENVRTDPRDVSSLWAAQMGDIRQCLLQLQFWVRSGGGGPAEAAPLLLSHPVTPLCLPCGRAPSHDQEESVAKWKNPADLPQCDTGCSGTQQEILAVHELARMFKVHTWTTSENRRYSEILLESQQRGVDLLYLNMEALLPLTNTTSPNPNDYMKGVSDSGLHRDTQAKEPPEPSSVLDSKPLGERPSSKARKRRGLSLKGLQRPKPDSPEKTETTSLHHCHSEGRTEMRSKENNTSGLVLSGLESLAGFLDDLSTLDRFLQDGHVRRTGHCTPDLLCVPSRAELRDGMLDEMRDDQEEEEKRTWRHKASDIRAAVEGMSFRRCCLEIEQAMVMARVQTLGEEGKDQCKQVLEQLTFPPPPHTRGLLSSQPSYTETNVAERRADLIRTLLSSKALSRLGSSPAVITDYLPCLRTICKAERLQDKGKTRHRGSFLYLNLSGIDRVALRFNENDVVFSQ